MRQIAILVLLFVVLIGVSLSFGNLSYAGPYYASGQITSLLSHGTDPAIRLTSNVTPDSCDGGNYGWIYFQGTPEERSRMFATALALSLTGKAVTVYTNSDNQQCRINNIQVVEMN